MVSFHSSKLQYVSCQRHPFYSWPNSKCSKNCSKITLKLSHLNFQFWHFSLTFFLLKLTCLVTLFDSKLQVLKTRQTGPLFCFVPTQNVNIARFAREVENETFVLIFKQSARL